jgi:sugar lactone lactonase YvrE
MKTVKLFFCLFAIALVGCSKSDDEASKPSSKLAISGINPNSGPKNTTVFITGVDFSPNAASNTVTLNGKACTVNTASATSLSITIPRGAGSGAISVTVNGTTVQSPNFDYLITPSIVSTFAGSTFGFADATSTAAQFNSPSFGVFDAAGNYYVTDFLNYKIRKITPAGVVSTFAGSTNGFADGNGTAAKFSSIIGIGIDGSGNLFVSDETRIRKITPTGDVTTFAGSGTVGFADGMGNSAQFFKCTGLCLDALGNIFVAESGNQRIRKITPAGMVTTLAGGTIGYSDGLGTAAKFNNPQGICVDSAGNLFVADFNNNKIRKVSPTGDVTTVAGTTTGFADGAASAAMFSSPTGITTDQNNNLYVADYNNHRIRKITAAGIVSTVAGSTSGFQDGGAANAKFNTPYGITVGALGTLYVVEEGNNKIRLITID